MNRPDFERIMTELRARIAEVPETERAALEQLAQETVERHESIARSSLQATRALERLELACERFDEACHRLGGLAEDAKRTLQRVQAQSALNPPGVN